MGGVRNGAAEDDGHWDLKPRRGSYRKEDHVVLGEKGERTTLLWQSGDPVVVTQLTVTQLMEPESRTSTSFPEIWYPRLGRGEKEGLCGSEGILKNFSILMKTLSHYS